MTAAPRGSTLPAAMGSRGVRWGMTGAWRDDDRPVNLDDERMPDPVEDEYEVRRDDHRLKGDPPPPRAEDPAAAARANGCRTERGGWPALRGEAPTHAGKP